MHPATILLPGPPFELLHQSLSTFRHPPQARLDLVAVGERMQALRPGSQLARGLGTTQQQHREKSLCVGVELEPLVEHLVVLQCSPPGVRPTDAKESAV